MHQLTFQILVVLHEGSANGQTILHRLRELGDAGAEPSLPTLYRYLGAALAEDWIETTGGDLDPAPGRPPQTYRLTAAGREVVEAEARRHQKLAALVLGPEDAGDRKRPR